MNTVEVPNCPICNGAATIMDRVPTIHPDADDVVELRVCADCGHWWHSPIPDQATLQSLYESASPYVVGPGARELYRVEKTGQSFHRFIFETLSAPTVQERYLEIGTGGGHLLRRFRDQGYECYGVDPGQWIPDVAIYPNLKTLPSDLSFGVIVLQDVLEHVVDPLALLKRLRSIAVEGALIFTSFPCCESRPARRYRSTWNMVRPYGHVHYFSRASTKELFYRTGWAVQEARLSRHQSLVTLLAECRWKAVAYECVKGGRDQLYVRASA